MSQHKEKTILTVREKLGATYAELRWLTEAEAKDANQKREELLRSFSDRVNYGFADTKIYTGKLSPGCQICGQGKYSCMYINGLCTSNCFYCPQDRTIKAEREAFAENIQFRTPDEYVDYVKLMGFEGVGFSGGEPFLVFDKLCSYLESIRDEFGQDIYVWVYTNGSIVDKEKLKTLKVLGLNEIRFNICAGNYDLEKIELAVPEIETVTVEIPAIPEDYPVVLEKMALMEKMGVKHLNLHQLLATEYNYRKLAPRGYSFLHRPTVAVLESEFAALKLIRHALEQDLRLPVNYCCAHYKHTFQGRGDRTRSAHLAKEPFEDLTETGHIRQLSVQASGKRIEELIGIFRRNQCAEDLWSWDGNGNELFIHASLVKFMNGNGDRLVFSYYQPSVVDRKCNCLAAGQVTFRSGRKLALAKMLVSSSKELSERAVESIRQLSLENRESQSVYRDFVRNYPLKEKEDRNRMLTEKDALIHVENIEKIKSGLSELF
jgi:uncharacterized protein